MLCWNFQEKRWQLINGGRKIFLSSIYKETTEFRGNIPDWKNNFYQRFIIVNEHKLNDCFVLVFYFHKLSTNNLIRDSLMCVFHLKRLQIFKYINKNKCDGDYY